MIKNKTLKRCTVAILIAVLLTFTANKAVSVSAFAITGTVVAASLLATGAVYLGYLALTGAEIQLPRENVAEYISNIGNKVAQYGTGAGIYAQVYNHLFNNGVEALNDYTITLDQDTLLGFYNTNKDIANIQETVSFVQATVSDAPTTNFDYPFTIAPIPQTVDYFGTTKTLDYILNTYSFPTLRYAYRIISSDANHTMFYAYYYNNNSADYELRNIKYTNGYYGVQAFINGTWTNVNYLREYFYTPDVYDANLYCSNGNLYVNRYSHTDTYIYETYPVLTDAVIYIQSTGEIIETVQNENGVYVNSPQWPDNRDPDNDNKPYPLVPYVELPTSTPGTNVPSQWGINTGDLLDKLDELADDMVTAGVIGELINAFKNSLIGTDAYNTYEYYTNEGDNYYYYYNNTFQDNDTYNNNTDIQDDEYLMPVDLNTLSTVANNEYISTIKNTAADISQTVGDYIAFWHNVDYQTVYILLGGALFLLLCGLIGKMGK